MCVRQKKRLWGTSGRRFCFSSNYYYFWSIWCLNQPCQVIRKRSAFLQYCCESQLIYVHRSLGKYLERKQSFQVQEKPHNFPILMLCEKQSKVYRVSYPLWLHCYLKGTEKILFIKYYIIKGGHISVGSGQKKLRSPRVSKIHVLNVIQIIKQIKHISSVWGFFFAILKFYLSWHIFISLSQEHILLCSVEIQGGTNGDILYKSMVEI